MFKVRSETFIMTQLFWLEFSFFDVTGILIDFSFFDITGILVDFSYLDITGIFVDLSLGHLSIHNTDSSYCLLYKRCMEAYNYVLLEFLAKTLRFWFQEGKVYLLITVFVIELILDDNCVLITRLNSVTHYLLSFYRNISVWTRATNKTKHYI